MQSNPDNESLSKMFLERIHAPTPSIPSNLPKEILSKIFSMSIGKQRIKVHSRTQEPLGRNAVLGKWKCSTLYVISRVSREWRDVVLDLRVWQDITIDHFSPAGDLGGPGPAFLKAIVDLAIEKNRKLKISISLWDSPGPDLHASLDSMALSCLASAPIDWQSFAYNAYARTALEKLCWVLEEVEPRLTQLTNLEINVDKVERRSVSVMAEVMSRIQSLRTVEQLVLFLGGGDNGWVVDWARDLLAQKPLAFFDGIKELHVRASPIAALKMVVLCSEVSRLSIHLDAQECEDRQVVGRIELEHLERMDVILSRNIGYKDFFKTIACPGLQVLNVKWERSDLTVNLESVTRFMNRTKGTLRGKAWMHGGGLDWMVEEFWKGLRWAMPMRHRNYIYWI
ncbi:hypothetical protein V5O48_012890 [Marasmius crinis-equi]|uniref:F-box domain-containing protein n=1 Tax=Marasmius crinis-equi TaxID=585013 RepID=A0ABR3F1L3_9AGAR